MKNSNIASEIIRKQFWIIIILIFGLIVSNGVWIWYINQYDFTNEIVEQQVEDIENSNITQSGVID